MYQVEIIGQKPVSESEGIKETDTSKTRMNHTMIRIKDPKVSLAYYQETMGMKLLRTSENKEAGFNLYFLGYGADAPSDSPNGVNPVAEREGLLELTWNYGTEKEEGPVYHNGNDEPQGKEDNLPALLQLLMFGNIQALVTSVWPSTIFRRPVRGSKRRMSTGRSVLPMVV